MESLHKSNLKELIDAEASIGFKLIAFLHSVETDLSETIYKIWCRMTGGKFVRNEANSSTACLLITKRTTNLSTIFLNFSSTFLRPLKFLFPKDDPVTFSLCIMSVKGLEMFELKCSEGATYREPTFFEHSKLEKEEKCAYCGRCIEIQEGDKKIVGKF